MNDIAATHPQYTTVLWKKISSIIHKVQKFTLENPLAQTKELLSHISLDELIVNEVGSGISIVYRPYNRPEMELIARREWPHNETNNTTDLLTSHTVLADAVNNGNGEPVFLPNEKQSLADVGFSGYKSILIIPIHLHYKMGVNIGAIILHHKTQENAYSDTEILTVWQTFVERLTFFIQQHHQTRRDQLSSSARIDLLQKLAADQLTEEYEIIWEITQQIRQWYREDRLFIIMKHLLDVDSYVFAYNDENDTDKVIIDNFRLQPSIEPEKLTRIIGSQDVIKKLRPEKSIHTKGLILSQDEIRTEGIDADCQSWLGITFYHPLGFALGHIILRNSSLHAYSEVDAGFFSKFADLLGIVLANIRGKQKEKTINDIKQGIIEQEESEENEVYYSRCENSLCNTVSTFLGKIYGVHSLLIARIDRRTQQFVTVLNQGNIAFDQEFQSVARAHIDKLRIPLPDDVMQDLRNHAKKLTVEYPEGSGNKYLIAPMLVEHTSAVDDRQIIGCFITKAKRAGGLTAKAIDEISNALAYRVVQFDRSRRFDILNQFSKEVAELKPNNLTQQSILEIAHRHIKEIMFGENLYISLYDKDKQEISFPLMYLDGQPKEQASRIIDSNALGRTEEIILTKKPLRHRTKVESKAWYETPGHGEFMGNHLASWIGVPIFAPDGIQGVIAAYHPNFDAIYSKLDLFFLSNIAAQVSGLLRSLELSEANANNTALQEANRQLKEKNQQLENAHQLIERQEYSANTVIKDLSFRINTNLGLARANIQEAYKDVEESYRLGQVNILPYTIKGLKSTEQYLDQIVNTMEMLKPESAYEFSLNDLLKTILRNINRSKSVNVKISEENIIIQSNYLMLLNAFYSIFEDVIDRLINVNLDGIQVLLKNTEDEVKVTISADGSLELNDALLINKISAASTPYYRAKSYLDKIGAKLVVKNPSSLEVNIPLNNKEKTPIIASVFDPNEGSIIVRWMLREGYDARQLEKLENLNTINSSVLIVAITPNNVSQQIHDIVNLLKQSTICKLILLVEAAIKNEALTAFDNIASVLIIRKLDGDMNLIKREDFISDLKKVGI